MIIKSLFHHKKHSSDPQPLQVQGIADAPPTAEPDDAELAAQALLELMADARAHHKAEHASGKPRHRRGKREPDGKQGKQADGKQDNGNDTPHDAPHDAAYYRRLADRIRFAYTVSKQRTSRFLSFCEWELRKSDLPLTGKGSLALLEAELYKRIDIVDREGGKLKDRWQRCLAEVTVRLMNANDTATDDTDHTDKKPE